MEPGPKLVTVSVEATHGDVGPTGEQEPCEGHEPGTVDVIVTAGGPDGQLPGTVLTTVTGVQVPPPPTGEVSQDPPPVVIVIGGSVTGTQVPPPPTGEVSQDPPPVVMVTGVQTPPPPPPVIVLHEVTGLQALVPTPPTGDEVGQLGVSVIVIAGSVVGEQVPTPPTGLVALPHVEVPP